ncbi:hypothetical protein [Lactococcus garvieae]|uniref:Anti-bacteriophage protein A/HamA C-terminal domain-containing protein n=1 Tax=Lactococcus garvieae TaxID=1363 RepID=A0AAX3ND05_9LACT|nr:hypothetical protein [Lactococcus garvieae]NHI69172.1 hypothetical protein [Lactococcus garvieae]NHJ06673.1 hypothetical protein [Lactococcus garvieae]WEA14573.1 hypothetical protein PWF74_03445 [Lactococcus garvieae]
MANLLNNQQQGTNKTNAHVIVVDIEDFSDEEKQYISEKLVEICKGASSSYPASVVAQKLLEQFKKASDKNKNGLSAEFLQAIILRNQGFSQKYLFSNLEENSAKKGFDGFYMFNGDNWILESKSSFIQTAHQNKHKTTIDRSYRGIVEMVSGNTSNDPWENAANHVQIADNANKSLLKKLEDLSVDYMNNRFQRIDDLRIIVGSTVVSDSISLIEKDTESIQKYITNHQAKEELIVVVNYKHIELLFAVLEEIANG